MNTLFVATDLTKLSGHYQTFEVTVGGKVYRRIDPEYYAWLRSKIELAKKKVAGRTYQVLRSRFLEIHKQAVNQFGVDTLKVATQNFDTRKYNPPGKQTSQYIENYEFPTGDHPEFKFTQKVRHHALNEVDRIKATALNAGWTEAELYQNRGRFRFPCGQDYGIVCSIDPGQRLGQITPEKIELICRGGHSLFFYRRSPYA